MNLFRDLPKVLAQKVIFTGVIGIGCLLIGGAYFLFAGDRTTLLLSAAILAFSAYRVLSLYRVVRGGKYEVVEGTCVAVRHKALRKHFTVKVMDDTGHETTLRLGKQAKVKIGSRYRFYFTHAEKVSLGSEYLDTALSQGAFLGFESLGDIMDTQEAKDTETPPQAE